MVDVVIALTRSETVWFVVVPLIAVSWVGFLALGYWLGGRR